MNNQCSCSNQLNESQYIDFNGATYKSCPSCSVREGHHVFYRFEDFGLRDMGDGRVLCQPWCPSCRNQQTPALIPAFSCGS